MDYRYDMTTILPPGRIASSIVEYWTRVRPPSLSKSNYINIKNKL